MFLHPLDRFVVIVHAGFRQVVIGIVGAGHELDAPVGDRVGRSIDIIGAHRDMLDALALVFLQVADDLPGFAPVFVDRDADAAAGRGQGAGKQAGILALDIEEADFAEIEQAAVEFEPLVHVAPEHVVGQVIEVVEPDAFGF